MGVRMEAIKIIDTVSEKGIYINNPELIKFINQKVEIIILPYNDNLSKKILDFAGKLDNDSCLDLQNSIDDCRKIDMGEW
jgi:hypothetical protein